MKSIFDTQKFDMPIEEIMSKGVISVRPNTTAEVCAKLMIDNRIGSVVVVDTSGKLLGIITKENLIKHVIAQNAAPETVKAFEIMSAPVITVKPKTTLTKAMEKMFKESIRHLVILDELNKIVGICTDTDIFKVVPQLILLEQEYIKFMVEDQETVNNAEVAGYCDDCREYSDSLFYNNGQYLCPSCSQEEVIEDEIET